jgi:hypothetical protein
MEVFSAFGLLMLVGLALPILLVLSALLFDLAVVVYVMITTRPSHAKRPRAALLPAARARAQHRIIGFYHWR